MSPGESGYWIVQIFALAGVIGISVFTIQHRRGKEEYLCGDCRFNSPTACLKKERPYALECTSYSANESAKITNE